MAGKRRRSSKNKEKKEKGIPYFDYNLLFIVIFLLCFGLVMLYSSSAYTSAIKNHDSMHYLKLQIRNIVLGLIPMVFLAKVDYRYWKKLGFFAYIVSLILCVLVFVPKIGSSSHGSSRWIGIGPIQFQPSEVAKIAVILFMAMIIDKIPKQFDKFLSLVKVLAMLIPLIIVVAISNLSTAVIIIGISVCMLFVASPKYLQFIIVAVAVVVFAVAFVMLAGYRSTRIEAWLHPETAGTDAVFQTMMGLYAIGSGGFEGTGLCQGLPTSIPVVSSDFIFAAICEELGVIFGLCLLLMYLSCFIYFINISMKIRDAFYKNVAFGFTICFIFQIFLNVGGVVKFIPSTGVTLPLVSYGVSSVVSTLIIFGIIQGICVLENRGVDKNVRQESISREEWTETPVAVRGQSNSGEKQRKQKKPVQRKAKTGYDRKETNSDEFWGE